MAQQYLIPALIGLFSLLFLGIGFWINSRIAAGKLAQQFSEIQSRHQAEHQQLLNDVALSRQREQQMLHEQSEHQNELLTSPKVIRPPTRARRRGDLSKHHVKTPSIASEVVRITIIRHT